MTKHEDTIQYFSAKASAYDETDNQPYWRLSDELLNYLLVEEFLPKAKEQEFTLLDAGAGTGRWSKNILDQYPNAHSHLVDLTEDMLAVASTKLTELGYSKRHTTQVGDVCNMPIGDQTADYAICFHNVIGFVDNPDQALKDICRTLKPNGQLAIMIPSYYHALYFSLNTLRLDEIDRIEQQHKVCYHDNMPPLSVFEMDSFGSLLAECGFEAVRQFGFPTTLYPGMDETQLQGSTEKLSSLLEQPIYREKLLNIEKRLCRKESLAGRGNNILVVCKRRA